MTEVGSARPEPVEGRAPSRFTDAVARDYDAARALPAAALEAVHARLGVAAGIRPGSQVLEVGAGTGVLAGPLLRSGCRYTGVDASAAMLGRFRAACVGARHAVPLLLQADLRALPFPDGSFDAVIAFRVFGVVPGWRRSVSECLRVLRPGGHLVVGRIERGADSLHGFLRDERNRLLERSGVEAGRPGASDGDVLALLATEAQAAVAPEPVDWMESVTPRRQIEQNLSGWRVQALTAGKREQLRAGLTVAAAARYGDLDGAIEEQAAFVLHTFRKLLTAAGRLHT